MRKSNTTAAMFLLPHGVAFLVFVAAPIVYGFVISLHKWYILSPHPEFVGIANYSAVVRDDLFRRAFWNTAYFVLLTVPLGNALSLLLAVGLNQNYRGTAFYKVAYYLPVLTSVSVVAILWRWLYNSDFGLANYYLNRIASAAHSAAPGVFSANWSVNWLGSPKTAMPSIALLSVWWGAGGNMLIYLAGLKNVPRELLEAAEIDGATPLRRFTAVTWPMLKPTTLFCLVMSVIASSQVFGQTYMLTGGGPYYSTLTLILYMYQQGFGLYQLGYASAVGYVLFAAVLAFTLLQFKLMAVRR